MKKLKSKRKLSMKNSISKLASISLISSSVLLFSACTTVDSDEITIGTSNFFFSIDPAATYASVDQEIMFNIYPTIFTNRPGNEKLENEIAESAEFLDPQTFSVSVKPNLTFSNGNSLTASDVEYSFRRQKLAFGPNNPSVLLANINQVTAVGDLTVEFDLAIANDRTIYHVLSSTAALIVDEEVFPPDSVMENPDIVEASPFAGQYLVNALEEGEYISFQPNPTYGGILGAPKNSGVVARFFEEPTNLVLAAKAGEIDVAMGWRSLAGPAVEELELAGMLIQSGVGAEPNFLVFDYRAQPFGSDTASPDPAKALAVRQAIAHIVDRRDLSSDAFFGTAEISYSSVPSKLPGSFDAFSSRYGNGAGEPDLDRARKTLSEAGISLPVALEISYTPERYGPTTLRALAQIADQLNQTELFDVRTKPMEWTAFREARLNGQVQAVHVAWGPDFGEADNYLTPIFRTDTSWIRNGYSNSKLDELLIAQAGEANPETRKELLRQAQEIIAEDVPVIPLLQTGRFALVKPGISGVTETLDATFKFRYGNITK